MRAGKWLWSYNNNHNNDDQQISNGKFGEKSQNITLRLAEHIRLHCQWENRPDRNRCLCRRLQTGLFLRPNRPATENPFFLGKINAIRSKNGCLLNFKSRIAQYTDITSSKLVATVTRVHTTVQYLKEPQVAFEGVVDFLTTESSVIKYDCEFEKSSKKYPATPLKPSQSVHRIIS